MYVRVLDTYHNCYGCWQREKALSMQIIPIKYTRAYRADVCAYRTQNLSMHVRILKSIRLYRPPHWRPPSALLFWSAQTHIS